jgi:hypothetical protein
MNDYLEKKKLADALRKAQARTAALQGTVLPNTIASPGAQGGGGVYSQPDWVQANWAAPAQQLGLAWMEKGQEERAGAAEAEAEAAKQAEMEAVMQQGASGGTITPEMAIKLQNLGVDAATMKLIMPSKTNLGAVTQAARDPAGIRALVATGTWTKEQGDEALAQLAVDKAADTQTERDQYKWEQQNKAFAPPSPNETDFDRKLALYKSDPETYAAIYGPKGGAGGATTGRYDPAREAQVLKDTAATLRDTISKHGDEMFGVAQTGAALLRKTGSENPGSLIGNIAEAAGTKLESPANAVMRSSAIDATLEQIAKMAPASDTDIRTLLANRANAFQSKESALEFIALMERVADRYKNGRGLFVPGATNPIEDVSEEEMDALMGRGPQ